MEITEEILTRLSQSSNLKCTLHVDGQIFPLQGTLTKSKIPIRKPGIRGGVYFTDTAAYKVKATTKDLSIVELLPKLMLGPNAEFRSVEIRTSLQIDNVDRDIILVSHLTNTMNTKSKVEVNLVIEKVTLD